MMSIAGMVSFNRLLAQTKSSEAVMALVASGAGASGAGRASGSGGADGAIW